MLRFPDGFYWGTATSAHQVEGGTRNDWSEWERTNAGRLASEAATRFGHLPQWSSFRREAERPQDYFSGKACDHYHRYESDFDLAQSLGHNTHRLSIEWSRIEPEEGKWDEKEIEHYRKVIRALRARGMEPFATLWHWSLPVWMRDKGGWRSDEILNYFPRYAEKVVSALKDDVRFWITINEPELYAGHAYFKGVWPPQQMGIIPYGAAFYNLIEAHVRSYARIKAVHPAAQVGIAKNNIYFDARGGGVISRVVAFFARWWWNAHFLNQVRRHQDFIGLNYYFHNRVRGFRFNQNANEWVSDMGWEIYPEGLYHVLLALKRYKVPIYITENGVADAGDRHRARFIREHLRWAHKAIQDGVDVRGYFYWSLLDNFEWDKGFWPRFGLIEVDYKTFARKVRSSAEAYREIIARNGLEN